MRDVNEFTDADLNDILVNDEDERNDDGSSLIQEESLSVVVVVVKSSVKLLTLRLSHSGGVNGTL